MTPERFQQIDKIYQAALDQDAADRPKFLSNICADDSELRREVESLLIAHDRAGSFIVEPALRSAAKSLANDQAKSLIGTTLAHYRIESVLGAGGMGEVYLALDMKLNRKVALKVLPASFNNYADQLCRFEQEARAASALNHPNIITIYEIGEADGRPFIVNEFVEGNTLREQMTNKRMTVGEVLDLAAQIASALQAAHEAGIVHRDIKPENIMIRRDGVVKVLDFGLAKLTSQHVGGLDVQGLVQNAVQTNPGMVMGTAAYMSPEQARGGDVDVRTDLWSLGVVLYEMASGRGPFVGETPSHVIVSILGDEPPPLATASNVPDEFQRIASRALSKNREHRYQTAEEFQIDLKRLRQRMELDAAMEGASDPFAANPAIPTNAQHRAVATDDGAVGRTSLRFAQLANTFKLNKAAWVVAGLILTISLLAYGYWRYERKISGDTIHSIAVLPFENQTNDPDSDYLSDGISESLINHLSQLPGVKVSARSSSFKYRGKSVDLSEAAKALSVDAILTGRIKRRGDDLVIGVELIDARDLTQLWGEQYKRKLEDVLAVQTDISSEIVQRLRVQLNQSEQQQIAKGDTVNLQAYELFLKGRFTWDKGGTENRKKAVDFYQQAFTVDPQYALAYAELSRGFDTLITNNELNPKEFASKAEAAARKAIELDANLAEGHLAMGRVRMSAWDWAAAELEIKRAIELNPNLVAAHNAYAVYLMIHGKREEAVVQLNRVRELDPLSLSAKVAVLTSLYLFRQNDQALEVAKKILETDRNNANLHLEVGESYARLHRYREAIAAYQEAIRLGEDSPDAQMLLSAAYARNGERDKAQAFIRRFESGNEYCSPVDLATVHLALGERDKALASLEAAYAAHDQQLIWLRVAYQFEELQSDPRLQDLARRVGLLS